MVIAVLSGKGGTGKTTVAVNLALSLTEQERIVLVDADVEEPNAALYLKPNLAVGEVIPVTVPVPEIARERCDYCGRCADFCQYGALAVAAGSVLTFQELCHGCGGCALVCPKAAIRELPREIGTVEKGQAGRLTFWQGRLKIGEPFAVPVTRCLKQEIGKLDCLAAVIVDSPPGAGCPVVEAVRDSDFALLVTEPTPFGRHDLGIALKLVRQMNIPHGVVINRAGEGDRIIKELCAGYDVPVLLEIPFSTQLASLGARGIPFSRVLPFWQGKFQEMYSLIKERSRCASS
jgi:MinD superfamily P-loop ATPase